MRLLPELADKVPDLAEPIRGEADAERVRLFEAVSKFLSAASSAQPIALLLDDLPGIDERPVEELRHPTQPAQGRCQKSPVRPSRSRMA